MRNLLRARAFGLPSGQAVAQRLGLTPLTQEELESVEPGRSRTIDIADFVDATEIDPVYYDKSYYLAPTDDGAKKAYALLLKAMAKAERIGVATFVMRGKQYLAAIRPQDNVLVLETMFFGDEVRDPADTIDQRARSSVRCGFPSSLSSCTTTRLSSSSRPPPR